MDETDRRPTEQETTEALKAHGWTRYDQSLVDWLEPGEQLWTRANDVTDKSDQAVPTYEADLLVSFSWWDALTDVNHDAFDLPFAVQYVTDTLDERARSWAES